MISHLSDITIKLPGSAKEVIPDFNKIEGNRWLLRWEIDQTFHDIYEHAVLIAEKGNAQPNISGKSSKRICKQNEPADNNRKDKVESYYLKNIAIPFLDNVWVEID